jgi:hypothetical protein
MLISWDDVDRTEVAGWHPVRGWRDACWIVGDPAAGISLRGIAAALADRGIPPRAAAPGAPSRSRASSPAPQIRRSLMSKARHDRARIVNIMDSVFALTEEIYTEQTGIEIFDGSGEYRSEEVQRLHAAMEEHLNLLVEQLRSEEARRNPR